MASLPVPARVEIEELLDEHDAPIDDVERSLRDLRRFNRFLGGKRAWKLLTRLTAGGSPASILEIGTGTSDLLESVAHIPKRIGLDLKLDHLVYGRQVGDQSVMRVVGDAKHLPFRDGAIDVAGSSHFFHHFSPGDNGTILDECLRVCTRGVFATDTRRSYFPLIFVRLLGMLRLVGRITRFDAPASVIQGYTLQEIRSFASRFCEMSIDVFRIAPFRFGLVVRKEGRRDG